MSLNEQSGLEMEFQEEVDTLDQQKTKQNECHVKKLNSVA
jgi:hypothetical protein